MNFILPEYISITHLTTLRLDGCTVGVYFMTTVEKSNNIFRVYFDIHVHCSDGAVARLR